VHLSELGLHLRRTCSHTVIHRAFERLAAILLQGGRESATKCSSAAGVTQQRTTCGQLAATATKQAAASTKPDGPSTTVLHQRRDSTRKGGWSDKARSEGGVSGHRTDSERPVSGPPQRNGAEDGPLSEAEFRAVVAAMQALHGV